MELGTCVSQAVLADGGHICPILEDAEKRHRFGRSSEKHEAEGQISFMEVDGKIVFFNEAEAVAAEEPTKDPETIPHRKPKKKPGKREEDLEGLPVVVVEHSMTEEEPENLFGKEGWKQLPDEVYRRYGFTPAKVEVEEHHVKVYAGKKTDEIVRAPHADKIEQTFYEHVNKIFNDEVCDWKKLRQENNS